jgi:hypothetical protein
MDGHIRRCLTACQSSRGSPTGRRLQSTARKYDTQEAWLRDIGQFAMYVSMQGNLKELNPACSGNSH